MEKIYGLFQIEKFVKGYDLINEKPCYFPNNMSLYCLIQGLDNVQQMLTHNQTGLDERVDYFIGVLELSIGRVGSPYLHPLEIPSIYQYDNDNNTYIPVDESSYILYLPSDSEYHPFAFAKEEDVMTFTYQGLGESTTSKLIVDNVIGNDLLAIINLFKSLREKETLPKTYLVGDIPIQEFLENAIFNKHYFNRLLKINIQNFDVFKVIIQQACYNQPIDWELIKNDFIYKEICNICIKE